ncbi:MAG TPA: alpha/beta hydrolase [Rhodospirillaceae bacterium]|nr:alpha/beta hydrolase [Rhodospirillaceae bacterium]
MTATAAAKVWLDYDQAELDNQYEQRSLVPDGDVYVAENAAASAQARADLDCRLDVAYGPGPDEVMDLFPARASGAPVLVFLHGGAWTRGDKVNESHLAPALIAAGAAVVAVNFSLAPGASLDDIADQCRRAVAWVHAHAADLNADAGRLIVAGHSSGAHLTAMMMVTDWAGHGLPADAVKGCVMTSGMYDLTPIRLSHRNGYLNLDDAAVDRLSPMRHLRPGLPPVAVFYGEGELTEFRRHGRDFAQALRDAGLTVRETDLPGIHHFTMSRELGRPDSPVHQAALRLMGLTV